MKRVTCFTVVVAFLLAAAAPAFGQTCGDVNNSGEVNISDVIYLYSHIVGQGPPPVYQNMADCDDHYGITIGDVYHLYNYFFGMPPGNPPDCSPAISYSYAPAPNDTVFMPRVYGIPESADLVFVLIMTSFETSTVGFFLLLSMPFGVDEVF